MVRLFCLFCSLFLIVVIHGVDGDGGRRIGIVVVLVCVTADGTKWQTIAHETKKHSTDTVPSKFVCK